MLNSSGSTVVPGNFAKKILLIKRFANLKMRNKLQISLLVLSHSERNFKSCPLLISSLFYPLYYVNSIAKFDGSTLN
jgi:hypothetical protein